MPRYNNNISRILSESQLNIISLFNHNICESTPNQPPEEIAKILLAFAYRSINNHPVNSGEGISNNPITFRIAENGKGPQGTDAFSMAIAQIINAKKLLKDDLVYLAASLLVEPMQKNPNIIDEIYLELLDYPEISHRLILREIMIETAIAAKGEPRAFEPQSIINGVIRYNDKLQRLFLEKKLYCETFVPSREDLVREANKIRNTYLLQQHMIYKDGLYYEMYGSKISDRDDYIKRDHIRNILTANIRETENVTLEQAQQIFLRHPLEAELSLVAAIHRGTNDHKQNKQETKQLKESAPSALEIKQNDVKIENNVTENLKASIVNGEGKSLFQNEKKQENIQKPLNLESYLKQNPGNADIVNQLRLIKASITPNAFKEFMEKTVFETLDTVNKQTILDLTPLLVENQPPIPEIAPPTHKLATDVTAKHYAQKRQEIRKYNHNNEPQKTTTSNQPNHNSLTDNKAWPRGNTNHNYQAPYRNSQPKHHSNRKQRDYPQPNQSWDRENANNGTNIKAAPFVPKSARTKVLNERASGLLARNTNL